MKKIKVNSWDEMQPLEVVAVGSTYDSSFFDGVKNKKIGDVLKKIVDETNEDIEYFKQQMRSHNIEVLQASPKELGYKDSILDYADINGRIGYNTDVSDISKKNLIPTSPLQIRDDAVVMGEKLLITDKTFEVAGYTKKFIEWFGEDQVDLTVYDGEFQFTRSEVNLKAEARDHGLDEEYYLKNPNETVNKLSGFCSPNLTRIGTSCIVDLWQTLELETFLDQKYPIFKYKSLAIGGHLDSVFSILKPGLVIAGPWFKGNENLFPGWEIIYFNDANWSHVAEWFSLRDKNRGKWWVPGEESNDQFTEFVESFLPNWTGYCEETIFDLNCLVVDDRHVVVNSDNPELMKVLKKHNITPIVCPLRNRFFWDGGWHCLTLDIKRTGGQIDYGI
jgi:hypothetical protein